jgi:UDP-N-acetylmuramoyl-L-alanyl-D-glutamate--2,6-diaminopimelate ligase
MKKLSDILTGIDCELLGSDAININRIVFDSRIAGEGDLFVALKGTAQDGHMYIDEVVKNGVKCILCEVPPKTISDAIVLIQVANSHQALGLLASNFYGRPSEKFKLVGITGTNGKTSIATLLHNLFLNLGYKSGLLSTVVNLIGDKPMAATHTTPDAVSLNKILAEMVEAGCDYVFMEVSSHAIDQKRIAGLNFDGGVFTNITHDHLDYHLTFDNYLQAKKQFFDALSASAFALVNLDDKRGRVMVQNTEAAVKTFSLHHLADFKGKVIENHFDGTLLTINNIEVWTQLIGRFNASNLLAVYGVAILLNQDPQDVLQHISALEHVDGRFEYVRSNTGVTAIVDYAHTPDALKNVLETINEIRQGGGQLITVVGAGGNRDKTKRPEMGKIAANTSDKVIFTSDNPRNEEPQTILEELLSGVEIHRRTKVLSIADRREAIRTACMMAVSGDIILIAGKGHENYQEIKGVKLHFSDKETVSECFLLNQIANQ